MLRHFRLFFSSDVFGFPLRGPEYSLAMFKVFVRYGVVVLVLKKNLKLTYESEYCRWGYGNSCVDDFGDIEGCAVRKQKWCSSDCGAWQHFHLTGHRSWLRSSLFCDLNKAEYCSHVSMELWNMLFNSQKGMWHWCFKVVILRGYNQQNISRNVVWPWIWMHRIRTLLGYWYRQ